MDFLGAAHDLTSLRSQQGPKNQSSASAVFGVSCIYCSYPVPPQPRIPGAKNMFSSGCPSKKMVRILVVTITGFGVDLSWMLMSVIVVRCLQKKCGKYGRSQIWKTKCKHISFPTWCCFFSSTTFNFLTWLPTNCVGTSNIYQTLPRLFEVAGKGFGKQNPCVTLIRIQRKLIAKTH